MITHNVLSVIRYNPFTVMSAENHASGYFPWRAEVDRRGIPMVEYDGDMFAEELPYTVAIDVEGYAKMLSDLGMTDERIAGLTVRVKKRSPLGLRGLYAHRKREITIYADPQWKTYRRYRRIANNLAQGKTSIVDELVGLGPFEEFLEDRQFSTYLDHASPERAREFTDFLLDQAVERIGSITAAHEAKHAVDRTSRRLATFTLLFQNAPWLLAVWSGPLIQSLNSGGLRRVVESIGVTPPGQIPITDEVGLAAMGLGASYFLIAQILDPYEVRARNFGNAAKKNLEWHRIVQFKSKEIIE